MSYYPSSFVFLSLSLSLYLSKVVKGCSLVYQQLTVLFMIEKSIMPVLKNTPPQKLKHLPPRLQKFDIMALLCTVWFLFFVYIVACTLIDWFRIVFGVKLVSTLTTNMYKHTHTFIHLYKHLYMHTYIHTYMHWYIKAL